MPFAIAILFDLDGTLINTLPDIEGVVNSVRMDFHLPPLPRDEVRACVGKGIDNLLRECFKNIPRCPELPVLIQRFRQRYLERPCWGGEVYPGVREGLLWLRSKPTVKLGVVTNKSTRAAEKTLEYYLPEIRFEIIAGPERVSEKKPHPAHLLEVLARLEVPPSRSYFIGDDPVDLACAKAAGVKFYAATYGYGGIVAENGNEVKSFKQILEKVGLRGNHHGSSPKL